ncbi:MAG TPA: GTPase HflX, partial [Alphaproteobacteria bacterium]|nr:GTPase HflX [Alphaproteobacteria bacterium]
DTLAQKSDVEGVLKMLGVSEQVDRGLVEVLNKSDLLPESERAALQTACARNENQIPVSAATGDGLDDLLRTIEDRLAAGRVEIDAVVPASDGAALAYLYRVGEVLARRDGEDGCFVRARLDDAGLRRFENSFPQVKYESSRPAKSR